MEKDIEVEVRCVVVVDARMPERPRVLALPHVFFDIVYLVTDVCNAISADRMGLLRVLVNLPVCPGGEE
jgi:hypothetical protein